MRRLPAEEIRAELGRLSVLVDNNGRPTRAGGDGLRRAHVRAAVGDG